MKKLNIKLPDSVTRVSEYIPEIIDFIKLIIKNGYGYEKNGSVYFDITEFKKSHKYAKLEPSAANSQELIAEGEGALSATHAHEKKNFQDFALWKTSKEGEPKWDSPWG
jgi:cysteinyl-tRNA synthetase